MGMDHITIEVLGGSEDGKIFEFSKFPITLGRHHEDDLYLPSDASISRHHARILRDGQVFFIEDLGHDGKGSTNGTFLNDERIVGITPLLSGEMFIIGNICLRFSVL